MNADEFKKHLNFRRNIKIGNYNLVILGPEYNDIDFKASQNNLNYLVGLFNDDWPFNLTNEQNIKDLELHVHDFEHNNNYAWVIENDKKDYLGCCYYYPRITNNIINSVDTYIWFDKEKIINESIDVNEFYTMFKKYITGDNFPNVNIYLYTPDNKQKAVTIC